FFSSRRRHTRSDRDWSSDVCSSDLGLEMKPMKNPLQRASSRDEARSERAGGALHFTFWTHTGQSGGSFAVVKAINPDSFCTHLRSEERRVGKECRSRWWRYK